MVDALREAYRVLTSWGMLIDVRPIIAPIVVEVVVGTQVVWGKIIESYSAPDDIAAADAAMRHAIAREWFVFDSDLSFDFEIFCDTSTELSAYAEARKLQGEEIPYAELEERRRLCGEEQKARVRCRRRWMLSTYRKQYRGKQVEKHSTNHGW